MNQSPESKTTASPNCARPKKSQVSQKPYDETTVASNFEQTSFALEAKKQELEVINSRLKQLKEQLISKEVGN